MEFDLNCNCEGIQIVQDYLVNTSLNSKFVKEFKLHVTYLVSGQERPATLFDPPEYMEIDSIEIELIAIEFDDRSIYKVASSDFEDEELEGLASKLIADKAFNNFLVKACWADLENVDDTY